ncbi:unannotated protein [freshwater metagenome]|uniref:Unannotated protein n=1 Tax=freshwater metagenome TaxID=449393 RepID=A0A6J6G6Z0_9ZZZZ
MTAVAMTAPNSAVAMRRGSSTTKAAIVSNGAPITMVVYVISRGSRFVRRSTAVRATRPATNTQ